MDDKYDTSRWPTGSSPANNRKRFLLIFSIPNRQVEEILLFIHTGESLTLIDAKRKNYVKNIVDAKSMESLKRCFLSEKCVLQFFFI